MNAFVTSTAVMARRVEPADSLDYFPTPPWATRAFCEHVLPRFKRRTSDGRFWLSARDPACGEAALVDEVQVHVVIREGRKRDAVLTGDGPVTQGRVVAEEGAQRVGVVGHHSSVRTAYSSGKKVRSSARCRNGTPLEPPVPVFSPMIRSTVFRWRNRHSWKLSSRSTSSSHVS